MDDGRFDAWTRRSFGLTAGGLAAAVLGLAATDDADAKNKRKRKKKKKCKKSEKRCGKKCVKGNCCPGTACGENCACGRTVEGRGFCFDTDFIVLCDQCNSSAECEDGFECVQDDGCPDVTARCRPACGAV